MKPRVQIRRHGDDDGDTSRAVFEDVDAEVDAVRAVKDEVQP
jgi:hypothetical protein